MRVFLVYLLLCGIWSSTWIFIKLGLDAGLPPVSFAALRFVVAAAVLLLILAANKISFPREKRFWILAGVTGFFQFSLNYALLFWGEQFINSGLAAVLQATIPAFGLILAQFYVPDERVTPRKIIGILLGIGGVAAIFYEQLNLSGWLSFAGCAAVILGAFFAAYASVLVKANGSKTNSTALLAAQMLFGIVPLIAVGLSWEGNLANFNWTWTAIICVLYLALAGSVAAFWLYYWLLKNIEVTKAMMISLVTPFVAVLIGSFYGEIPQAQTIVGGVLILMGVALILLAPKCRAAIEKLPDETVLEAQ